MGFIWGVNTGGFHFFKLFFIGPKEFRAKEQGELQVNLIEPTART